MEGANNFVLQDAYSKLRKSEALEGYERAALENFTDAFVTCTRCVTVAGEEAVRIAEEVNWHSHSSSCKKGGRRTCRWKFPRFPLARTIFVDANREDQGGRMDAKEREDILDRVMGVLVDESGIQKVLSKTVESIMLSGRYPNVKRINEKGQQEGTSFNARENSNFDAEENSNFDARENSNIGTGDDSNFDARKNSNIDTGNNSNFNAEENSKREAEKESKAEKVKRKQNAGSYVKMESPEEYKVNIRRRIEEVLAIASAGGTLITYEKYEQAVVEQPRKGSEVLLQRDIDEIMVNNYNAEWIVSWNANIDLSPVYDYFGTITYVTDYFTKVSSIIYL